MTSGLAAKRKLIKLGHGRINLDPRFPSKEIGTSIAKSSSMYFHTLVPTHKDLRGFPNWTILEGYERTGQNNEETPYQGLAQLAARYGLDALSDIPSYSVGALFSVDRHEIQSLRILESLIRQYESGGHQKKPLSIGVFGPPGSGKSFGVKALSKSILGKNVPFLEFNLSQFKDPGELIGAFHQIRDKVLSGQTPVAFWDEFDSQQFRWLQYLLAPMQDGAFQEGQLTHPIGKCVFIFAGGTSFTFEDFANKSAHSISEEDYKKLSSEDRRRYDDKVEKFKLLKGPDFASRLHGFLNVLGPNKRRGKEKHLPPDRTWPIRRALILRGLLRLKPDAYLDIDIGLLAALLLVDEYTHGARSFEKVVRSLQGGRLEDGKLVRSALPPSALLQQETNLKHFQELLDLDQIILDPDLVDKLAAAVHGQYMGADESTDIFEVFNALSDDQKAANRSAARRIPHHLSLIDYKVGEATDSKWKKELQKVIDKNIERLAKAEHFEWCIERRSNGWIPGNARDNERKIHPSLVSWVKLSQEERELDRRNVRMMPKLLQQAGLQAVPV